MKTSMLLLVGAVAVTAAGCGPKAVTLEEKARHNQMLVDYHGVEAQEAAVLRQATLFPYHFEAASARLNPLGERDVMILANRCREAPGDAPALINVRQGDSPDNLYKARVRVVTERFAAAGVSVGTVVEDGLPGGDGMSAERVLTIKDRVPTGKDSQGMSGSGVSSGLLRQP